MADSNLIRGPFGSAVDPNIPEVPEPVLPGLGAANPDGARIPVSDINFAHDRGFGEARTARNVKAAAPEATMLESLGAAFNSWDTSRLIKRLGRPDFDGDTKINQHEFLEHIPLVLSEDEREYFLDVGKGVQSAQYAVEQIEDRRRASGAIGDHPVVGMAGSFIDPLWLVVPPAIRVGKTTGKAGRAVSAVAAGALGAAVTASGEGPVSDNEIAMSLIMNAAAGAVFYKPGKGFVHTDPTLPREAAEDAIKAASVPPNPNPQATQKLVPTENGGAVIEEFPKELQLGAVNTDAAGVVRAVDTAIGQSSRAQGLGSKLMWNMHRTMSGFGEVGKKIANILYDNNSDLSFHSMESHRESILDGLRAHQFEYEGLMRQAMAEDGFGTLKMVNPFTSRDAYAAQRRIELEVQRELFRREQFTRQGIPLTADGVSPRITAMADKLDALHKQALQEMKAAGVEGAENLLERPGYLNRKWSSSAIDGMMDRLEALGLTRDAAHARVTSLVGRALRLANPAMDKEMADQVGQSIVRRALNKGYFEDTAFNSPATTGTLIELREIMRDGGMSHDNIERALERLRVSTDEQGKQSFMKHRMDLDYRTSMRVGSEEFSVMDLIDSRVSTIVDQYIQRSATTSAFARMGLKRGSDVEALRTELLHSLPENAREEAKNLFDNTLAHYRGDPSGAKVGENFRLMQSYGRAVSLAWSGLWQMTEYATAMGEYGLGKTLKYSLQELPGFKSLMRPSVEDARSLENVLAEHSSSSMRMRPFLAKFEDGYEMDTGNAIQLSAQAWNQMVPYANAMKYVHHHQARVVGNLILDRVEQAARGNTKAREALAQYGIESHLMDKLAAEIKSKGLNVDSWENGVWDGVRPAFGKMMDAAVLKGRLGDMPAFAAFDPVGKFIFTYRTFVLAAHNKVLAGGLERNGAAAVGLVMMYQLPLSLAAVQAQSVIRGDGPLKDDALIKKAVGQMGGLGMFSEPLKWATGESNAVGAPGLIPVDRGVKLFQSAVNADAGQGASTALTMLPVVSASPFIQGMAKQIKE